MTRTDLIRGTALRAADELGLLTYVGINQAGQYQVVLAGPLLLAPEAVLPWLVGFAGGRRRLEGLVELVPDLLAAAGITAPSGSTQG